MEAAMLTFEESSAAKLEETSEATEAIRQELRNEQKKVDNIGSLEDRHLVVPRLRRLRKRTEGNGGFRHKLAAMLSLHCVRVLTRAVLQAHSGRNDGRARSITTQGIKALEGDNLMMENTSCRNFRKTLELKMEKRIVWSDWAAMNG
jgi:hypothetical protein